MPLRPLIPDKNASLRAAIRAVDSKVRPDFRRAIVCAVPVGNLLVGGAVTGMILGIVAQQSLSNVCAGLVLLFARPYIPGERVRIRSGALGGTLDGTVTSVGLLYTTC